MIHSSVAPSGFSPSVEVLVTIDEYGNVVSAHALSGPKKVFSEAEAAEKLLHFKPISRDGRPVRATFTDIVAVLPPERWRTTHVPFPAVRRPNTVTFRMERRYGCASDARCVTYSVQINSNRAVQFSEGHFVSHNPRHLQGSISPENYARLLNNFRIADFYSMEGQYDSSMTDAEGIRISITFDGATRTVETYAGRLAGTPDAFYRLAAAFDDLAGTDKWIKH